MSYYGVNSNTMRFVGMASGLDVDAIVQSIIKVEQLKIDSISQKKSLVELKQDAYKDINNLIFDFNTKYFSAASPNTNVNMSSSFNIKKVEATTNQYATITAGSSANLGAYTINEITSLAKGASVESAKISSLSSDPENKITTSSKLADMGFDFVTEIDGEGIEVNKISFSINGVDFSFNDTDTLQNVINTVNRSSAGVTMSYSQLSDKISIKSKTIGADSTFTVSDADDNNFFGALNINEATITSGTNAVLKINGYDVERSTNTFTIDGITYSLLQETGATPVETSFVVSQDIDAVFDRIKGFIDGYNQLITTLNNKISEPRYRSFLPLTDSQKSSMSEKEITEWEAKSNSGMLNRDRNIRDLLTNLRSVFSTNIEGLGVTFAQIGISTGDWRENGLMHINTNKLKEAIANNPEGVANLFNKTSSSTDSSTKYNASGLVYRFNTNLNNYTNHVKNTSLTTTSKQISTYDDRITTAIRKMNEKEIALYRQYATLEKALSSMYSQSSYFESLLYGGN